MFFKRIKQDFHVEKEAACHHAISIKDGMEISGFKTHGSQPITYIRDKTQTQEVDEDYNLSPTSPPSHGPMRRNLCQEAIKPVDDLIRNLNYKDTVIEVPTGGSCVQSPPVAPLRNLATKKKKIENGVNELMDDKTWGLNYKENGSKRSPGSNSCAESPSFPQPTKLARKKEEVENRVNGSMNDRIWGLNYKEAGLESSPGGFCAQSPAHPQPTKLQKQKQDVERIINDPLDDHIWNLNHDKLTMKFPTDGSCSLSPPLPQPSKLATKKEQAGKMMNKPFDDLAWRLKYK
ncbi:hypothetical protein N8I77_003424 [Diaporthe amygdali]|uniref:Uncharacterized protein n=1 Tax=Phomopsis amygdali TaxID=1214568 RepID=A0AAD9SKC7_PHOAM|nr:hypothetical protein N8I77_003424 [Diaporthe amygdali]